MDYPTSWGGLPPFPIRGDPATITSVQTTHMETWSVFSGSDIGLALIGVAGLVSVVVVLKTAFGNVTKREITLRQNARSQSNASDS
jgi:hypothetical protein